MIFLFILIILPIVLSGDLFLKLNHVPLHNSNITLLCLKTMEVESPLTNSSTYCTTSSNIEIGDLNYEIRYVIFKDITGNGYRLPPLELNAKLTNSSFFVDSLGSVVVVLNYWKMTVEIIVIIWVFFIILLFFAVLIQAMADK